MSEIAKRVADFKSGTTQELYVYDIPESMADQARDIKTVSLRLITPNMERMVTKRCGTDGVRLAYELTKASIAEINEEPVDAIEGDLDERFTKMHPAMRQILMTAYADLHSPPDGAAEDFLQSRRVKA